MKLPVIQGLIDRRILVNYRIDPDVLAKLLPSLFRPQLIHGHGMAGICLIRLKHVRPRGLPAAFGVASENAAHRIAVEWDCDGQTYSGVYIPRRDTSSTLNLLAGGRLFPGIHHRARFRVEEDVKRLSVSLDSEDGRTHLSVAGRVTDELPPDSIFDSINEASEFFEQGSLGYSDTRQPDIYDGLELESFNWHVEPLAVENVESSFFDDPTHFPLGSVNFDNALVMRGIRHRWHSRGRMVGGSV